MLKGGNYYEGIGISLEIRGKNTARTQERMEVRSWKALVTLFLISVSLFRQFLSHFICLLCASNHIIRICLPKAVKSICSSHKHGLVSEFQFQISRRKDLIGSVRVICSLPVPVNNNKGSCRHQGIKLDEEVEVLI